MRQNDLGLTNGFSNEPIVLVGASNIIISGLKVRLRQQPEHEGFLDIWHKPRDRYEAAAITLIDCHAVEIAGCDLRYNQIGVAAYGSTQLNVRNNDASHSSAWGFLLHDVTYSAYLSNLADFCCREGAGHLGGDAAGFLLVRGSSHNWFHDNKARLGGDGFFLAGYHHQSGLLAPCQYNEFLRNDVSWSPNNGFESTFCVGSRLIGNMAKGCQYGFWLGYDSGSRLSDNVVSHCQVGLAIENSRNGQVYGNQLKGNQHGWVVWSREYPWTDRFPHHLTSSHWVFDENVYRHNCVPAAIRANYSHGLYRIAEGSNAPAPCDIVCKDDIPVRGDGDDS